MIAYLNGRIIDILETTSVIDVGGVGYELNMSGQSLMDIELEQTLTVFVYTHVREDAMLLFGFVSRVEKEVFLSLIKVNGVGPKMAQNILSATRADKLVQIIEVGDVKELSKLPKIGKKKAEQMVLTLKGKLPQFNEQEEGLSRPVVSEIKFALVNLGFKSSDVELAIDKMDDNISVQDGVRQGLQLLTGQV